MNFDEYFTPESMIKDEVTNLVEYIAGRCDTPTQALELSHQIALGIQEALAAADWQYEIDEVKWKRHMARNRPPLRKGDPFKGDDR